MGRQQPGRPAPWPPSLQHPSLRSVAVLEPPPPTPSTCAVSELRPRPQVCAPGRKCAPPRREVAELGPPAAAPGPAEDNCAFLTCTLLHPRTTQITTGHFWVGFCSG